MKKVYTYILLLLVLCVSCQRVNLPEETLTETPDGMVGKKVLVTFSTAALINTETKAIIDPTTDIHTMYLILFDENGMLVEVCEAELHDSSDHGDHASGRHYTVTLTTTDKPRIVHFIANCPVDQIVYGHETSIIGNMYVDKNNTEHQTEYETSYWARIEVPYILVEEKVENGQTITSLHSTILNKFQHVPLLRNYAEIRVTDQTDDSFNFIGYTVYNVINRGTVAPYNNKTQTFQNFMYTDVETSNLTSFSYPQLTSAPYFYEGHALSSADLVTDLPLNDNGTVKIFASNEPFYIYERKVSVMTDEEEKWKESPPHIIIKGEYKPEGSDTWNTYYYKMDLVYKITDPETGIDTDIKYYHILRNFMYQFNLTAVHDAGYKTLEEAIAGAAGNNISGSADASKLTNVSDNNGRLWVSYTDTTLVDNSTISLKYKYIPNYYDATKSDYGVIRNDQVKFENVVGDVISGITGYDVAANDITADGTWKGYREVTISVKDPESTVKQQVLSLKTNSAYLNRDIRYTLRQKFNMTVECTPKVAANIEDSLTIDINLPIGLTEDMFPLELKMETLDKTISPNAVRNSIPVETGPSIIDIEDIKGTNSFYYVITIPTHSDYQRIPTVGNVKKYPTYWLTSMADNADTVYVDNKYFNQASDNWENYSKTFSAASLSPNPVPYGIGIEASVSFTMPNNDNTPVILKLTGLQDGAGNTTLTVTPTTGSADNVSVVTSGANKTVTISGLTTTTISDPVSVYIDAEGYRDESLNAERIINQFGVSGGGLGFNPVRITGEDDFRDKDVEFTFTVPVHYNNMEVNVTLDGLVPAFDDVNGLTEVDGRSAMKTYKFMPAAAGTYTFKLKTINKEACVCSLTLEAENYYYETETCTIEQSSAKYAFQKLTVPESVRYGAGRTVSITFQLDATDEAFRNKNVNVTLVGMTRNNATSFTYNTGNVGNNREVTIDNLVTTSADGNLRVTVEAAEYLPIVATVTVRTPGQFTEVKFNKQTTGAKVGEEVELSFTIDQNSYYSGMVVNLHLDRLEPVDGAYTYTPAQAGTHRIRLRTTEANEEQCTAQLKAEGMTDSEVAKVTQSAAPQKVLIWENNDNTEVSWNTYYRFGLNGKDDNNECYATFSSEIWDVIKNGTFYIKFRPTNSNFNNFNLKITTGHWSVTWRGANIQSGSNLIKNNGDGTYYVEINFSGDAILNNLDDQHLLFTGSGYRPLELYYYR